MLRGDDVGDVCRVVPVVSPYLVSQVVEFATLLRPFVFLDCLRGINRAESSANVVVYKIALTDGL